MGPSSKLARTSRSDAGVRAGGNSNKTGATAAEAVNLSDDDDDVVIIEEGMQPQSATTAPAKQPGEPSSTHVCVSRHKCTLMVQHMQGRLLTCLLAQASMADASCAPGFIKADVKTACLQTISL